MKRNYIAPATEQVAVKISPISAALSKKNAFNSDEDETDDALRVTSNGDISIGKHSLWDE